MIESNWNAYDFCKVEKFNKLTLDFAESPHFDEGLS